MDPARARRGDEDGEVVDDATAFVTSANLTEAAFDRNLELGVVSRDRILATSLARHLRALVDHGHLLPLP